MDKETAKIINDAEKLAIELAKLSGKMMLEGQEKIEIHAFKDRQDIVTNLDKNIEEAVISKIEGVFSGHNIFSEEIGDLKKSSEWKWILDPVDGTKYLLRNIPLFVSSIALQHKGELVMGVVFDPSTKRCYHATKGGGVFLNRERLSVSKTKNLEDAFICIDTPKINELSDRELTSVFERIKKLIGNTYRVRALGMGSIELCYLAQGGFEAYLDITGKEPFHDIAAGLIIAKEAGAKATDINGRELIGSAKHAVVSNGIIHDNLLKLLNK